MMRPTGILHNKSGHCTNETNGKLELNRNGFSQTKKQSAPVCSYPQDIP